MIVLCLLSVLALPVQDDAVVGGRLFVKLRAGHAARFDEHPAVLNERAALPAPRRHDRVGLPRIRTLSVEPGSEQRLAATLAAQSWVEWVELPRATRALLDMPPDDPGFDMQWAFDQPSDIDIDLQLGWSARGSCEVDADLVIGVIDSGIAVDTTLPDLAGLSTVKVSEPVNGLDDDGNGFVDDVSGFDFVDGDGVLATTNPHGTRVTSVLAARAGNGVGMVGVASGARVLHARAFDNLGLFPSSGPYPGQASVAASLVYLVDEGVDLINNSWGGVSSPSPMLLDALDYAVDNGVPLFFAAGNNDSDHGFPADHPDVIAVSGLQSDGAKAVFASYGRWVDVSAGALSILVTHPSGNLSLAHGTSFACPAAVGVAAHALSEDRKLSSSDLRRLLIDGGTDLDVFNPGHVGELGTHLNLAGSVGLLLPFDPVAPAQPPVTGSVEPILTAWGGTQAQQQVNFSLRGAAPSAPAAAVLGLSELNLQAVGGVLVPAPDVVSFFQTDERGEYLLSQVLADDLGAGTEVWVQMLGVDVAAPAGWSFSNVIKVTGQ